MSVKWLSAFAIVLLLTSCGGGSGGSSSSPTGSQQPVEESPVGGGNPFPGGGNPPPSPPDTDMPAPGPEPAPAPAPTPATFAATVAQAPADGEAIQGTIRIIIEGSGMENVELLPATGYQPLIARGVVTGDKKGAYIDFDTTVLPDGPIDVRVAAFNVPPGQGGSEITAMRARTWTIENNTAPAFSAQLVQAPETTSETFWLGSQPGGGTISPTVYFEVSGTRLGNVELVSAHDVNVKYGRFTISPDRTRASLDWDYRSYNGWYYAVYEVRVLAWDVPPGESGQMIEVMAPRTYYQNLPRACQGEGTCGGTAP